MNDSTVSTNAHGVEAFSGQIFSWDEIDRIRFDEEQSEGQLISVEQMHLVRAVYEPGATYPMHSRPHEQFSLLLAGRILLTVGDETREISPGDGWYAAANVLHGGKIIGDENAVFVDFDSSATRCLSNRLKAAAKDCSQGILRRTNYS
jgi:quercetin dioxygenase-like cupin family protein